LWQYVIDELCFLRSEWRSINRLLQYLRMNWQISYKNFIYTNVALQLNAESYALAIKRESRNLITRAIVEDDGLGTARCASSLD